MMSTLTPPLKNLKDTQWTSNNMCKTSKKNCGKFCNKISKLIDQDQVSHSLRKSWMLFQECSENILQFMLHSHQEQASMQKTLISHSELCTRQRSIFSLEFTLRISIVSMSIKARNLWVKVGLSSLTYVKDQSMCTWI